MTVQELTYYRADERPYWQPTVTVSDSTANDLSSGHTFTVLIKKGSQTPLVTKTTGITGAVDGVVTVAWSTSDLDITPDRYRCLLTVRRTSDTRDWTVEIPLTILTK